MIHVIHEACPSPVCPCGCECVRRRVRGLTLCIESRTESNAVYDRTLRSMCGPGGGSPSRPIPSPHERPGRGGARRTVARLGSPSPRPSLLAASARRRRRASQMFASALTGRMHKQHISDPSSCYIRTVARAWTCCVHEPPEAAWPPPPTAPAVRSTATLRRLALLLAVAAKLASQRLETPLLLPRLPRLPSCSPLMLPRQPDMFGTRENRTSYSQKPPRSAPSVGRRADANRKRAAGRQVWRAEGRLSSGSIFRRLGLMERAGKPDECLGSTLIPQVLQ